LEPAEALLLVLDPDVVPVDGALARRAALLFRCFGKGQGPAAQLNVGDCFAAALAEREPLPLAFARGDFSAAGF
jgi:ribonuclease VapC